MDPVIIVGAGPVGLVTALGLARQGLPVTVVESEPALTHDLRAGSFHPPTLEMMAPYGITERMLAIGIRVPIWQMRDRQAGVVAEFDLGLLADLTPYPFRLHCEQYKLTPIAHELLGRHGGEVLFGTSFVGVEQDAHGVTTTVRTGAAERTLRGSWLVGADGGRSAVRKALDIEFEGFTWPERFLVVSIARDLAREGYADNAYVADPVEWCAIFHMPHEGPPGLWRLAFPTDVALPDEAVLDLAFCRRLLSGMLQDEGPIEIAYRSVYRVHQRVAKDFRRGRALLAGDAAHVNNPLGALGLNSGIHDAVNLAEKLGRVARGEAPEAELDRYVRQRRLTNIEYVQAMSIRNKRLLEEKDPAVRAERLEAMRALAADPARARAHLLDTSMINSVRRAAEIE